MKTLFLFLLLYGLVSCKVSEHRSVGIAIAKIIQDFYSVQDNQFDLIVYSAENSELKDIVNICLRAMVGTFSPLKVIYVRAVNQLIGINRSAILMFDNFDFYRDFHTRVRLINEYPKRFNFIVYVKGGQESQMENFILNRNVFEKPHVMHFTSFLAHGSDGKSLKIFALSMFRQPRCRDWVTTEVNRYLVEARIWENREFFLGECNNFNQCELVAEVSMPPYPPVVEFGAARLGEARLGENISFWGYAIDFNSEVAYNLNFSVLYHYQYGPKPTIIPDYLFYCYSQRRFYSLNLRGNHYTDTFTFVDSFFIISRFKPYSQFEKLVMPFDREVWHWLIATMAIALIVIGVVKLTPKTIRHFVFGRFVRTPLLNFVMVFFGGGMNVLPGRNFARYLLACYILFCLVIRTAYQGKQFEFLQKVMRPADPKTIDEMIEKGFEAFILFDEERLYDEMDFMKRIHYENVIDPGANYSEFFEKLLPEGSNHAFLCDTNNCGLDKNPLKHYSQLKENIISDGYVFTLLANSFLFAAFNRKVVQFVESGLSEKFVGKYFDNKILPDDDGPKVLTLDHLGAGFIVFLACIAIACSVFLIEKLSFLARELAARAWLTFQ